MKYELSSLAPLAHDPDFVPINIDAEGPPTVRHRRARPPADSPTFIDSALGVQLRLYAEMEAGVEAQQFLDDVADAQITLAVNLESLEESLDHVAYDPSTIAAAATMRRRLGELREMEEALADVCAASAYPVLAPLFLRDAPLSDYLRGLQAWTNGVVRALEQLSTELRVPPADWATLRSRLQEAAQFHLQELTELIYAEVAKLSASCREARAPLSELEPRLSHLFATAEWFLLTIRLRFG
jgi:hypothetical protein